jgi:Protein of unknown function (DUF2845)
MRPLMLALACAGFASVQPATADTLRCGSVLIEPGDDALYVLEKCGEPSPLVTITHPALLSGVNSNLYQIGITQSRWLITREPGQFRAVLTIGADGRVEDIAFGRRRSGD